MTRAAYVWATEELLHVIDELLTLNRVGTFDEEPDERRICDYARGVVARYRESQEAFERRHANSGGIIRSTGDHP